MGKILTNRSPVIKIRQTFPSSKFCTIRYVPLIEDTKCIYVDGVGEIVKVPNDSLYKLFLAGDQLTAARAKGAIKSRINSPTTTGRLAGLI